MQTPDLVQLMKEKAEKVQAVVTIVKNFPAACRYAVDLTRDQNGQTIAAPALDSADRSLLADRCGAAGLRLLSAPLAPHAQSIHTAVTYADWGIAETGTLVLDSRSEDLRLATMLAETHVAILPAVSIKPDTEALENDLNAALAGPDPAYLAFITGASRTADIERVLAIGVHGPKELHILIMETPADDQDRPEHQNI